MHSPSQAIVDRSYGAITTADELVSYINETRYYYTGHNILREIHKNKNESVFTIPLFIKSDTGSVVCPLALTHSLACLYIHYLGSSFL